jgi:exoribonuclease II
MALSADAQVVVYITLSRTYRVEDDAATIARLAGISLDTLSDIVEDGADWEPEESTIADMASHGTADVESEEWDVEEISEV